MRKIEGNFSIEPSSDVGSPSAEGREVIMPHDPTAGPVTAVRNVAIQSSLAQLKANDYYERYVKLIAPEVLDDLLSRLAPGWIPVELVLAHYQACENLMLSAEELEKLGRQVGERLQGTVLVSTAKKAREADFDFWTAVPALYRMWGRLNQGGSVQIVKLGAKAMLIETRGFPQNRFHYYRQAQLAVFAATHHSLGTPTREKIVSYSEKRGEMLIRVSWP